MKRNKRQVEQNQPSVAPGIDNDEELNEKASDREKRNGDFTEVTTLLWDEVERD